MQRQPVLGLVGVSGLGKTQLAVAYAHHAEDYDVMWWVHARRPEPLGSDVAALSEPSG